MKSLKRTGLQLWAKKKNYDRLKKRFLNLSTHGFITEIAVTGISLEILYKEGDDWLS